MQRRGSVQLLWGIAGLVRSARLAAAEQAWRLSKAPDNKVQLIQSCCTAPQAEKQAAGGSAPCQLQRLTGHVQRTERSRLSSVSAPAAQLLRLLGCQGADKRAAACRCAQHVFKCDDWPHHPGQLRMLQLHGVRHPRRVLADD